MHPTLSLIRAAHLYPDRQAMIYRDRIRTWRDVGERVPRLAGAILGLNLDKDDRVAMLGFNSDRYIEVFFACGWADLISVPLNTRWARAELEHAILDCAPRLLFVDDDFLEDGRHLRDADGSRIEHLVYMGDGLCPADCIDYEPFVAAGPVAPDASRADEDVFTICYTGGTTGRAKGVMLSVKNISVASMNWIRTLEFTDETRFLYTSGMFHLAGASPIFALTLAGGTHIVEPKFDPVPVMQTIERHRVTYCLFIPTMVTMLINHDDFSKYDLTSVTHCEYGGSPIQEPLLKRFMELLPTWQFFGAYGMTEISALACCLAPKYHTLKGPNSGRLTSTGTPVSIMLLKIVDQDGNELPRGQVGEIAMRGPTVMKGYWNRPEETAETIRNGWLYSGDGAYMDDEGFVYIVDRVKDMIVSGGENVYSTEVENAIASHPDVKECAVIGIPDSQWGEKVHAIVVPHSGKTLTEAKVIEHCRQLIGGYKCPRSVDIRDRPLPVSGAGKVLKADLREDYWSGTLRAVN